MRGFRRGPLNGVAAGKILTVDFGGDGVEHTGQVCANERHGGDDDHRNQSGKNSVFDCSNALLGLNFEPSIE